MTSHTHSNPHSHPHADRLDAVARMKRIAWFLEAHFGEVKVNMPEGPDEEHEPSVLVRLDGATAHINLVSLASPVQHVI